MDAEDVRRGVVLQRADKDRVEETFAPVRAIPDMALDGVMELPLPMGTPRSTPCTRPGINGTGGPIS